MSHILFLLFTVCFVFLAHFPQNAQAAKKKVCFEYHKKKVQTNVLRLMLLVGIIGCHTMFTWISMSKDSVNRLQVLPLMYYVIILMSFYNWVIILD
ncbi:hypothetical protein niasHT_014315 [Heterodera trifolii]|uniref:Uncharacterized protein n=1 Tax=Heterodera trifolii TaxID=157864 RepID=A0ABD2L7V5_9BILA